jgi:hypothetical protein
MSGLDIFAWIVLVILLGSAIGVFCIAGWLPGHIAKTRGHPWAEAVTVAGRCAVICLFSPRIRSRPVIPTVITFMASVTPMCRPLSCTI